MSLRTRIARLAKRRGGGVRMWAEPAGERDGLKWEAHVYEANGQRRVVVAPVPCDTLEEWSALVARHYRAIGHPLSPSTDAKRR